MTVVAQSTVWLIGAGRMAKDYAKVLSALSVKFIVVGRGVDSAQQFFADSGNEVITGGIAAALKTQSVPQQAIICTGVEQLANVTMEALDAGIQKLLVEKPGALNTQQMHKVYEHVKTTNASVLIAYNRRFYASVIEARKIIEQDGGLLSCHFEFTEWSHRISELLKGPGVKKAWMTANSSHVADLAFHLAGPPEDWHCWSGGCLDWHPSAARFCGAGRTTKGVYFSYFADWDAPGRWGVEFMTKHHRLIFRPMEELHVTRMDSVAIEKIEIDNSADLEFKPGLYEQTLRFLASDWDNFCTIAQQLEMSRVYEKMAGYDR